MKIWLMAAAACAMSFGISNTASAGIYLNTGDTSAYVHDWAIGPGYTNYAFLTSSGAFVGSWEVDEGPNWATAPTAYSGQGAAELLFGGNANDYTISTVDNIFADANHLAWVSTWGGACGGTFPCGVSVDESFVQATGAPEPGAWALMILGFGAIGAAFRRGRRVAVRYA